MKPSEPVDSRSRASGRSMALGRWAFGIATVGSLLVPVAFLAGFAVLSYFERVRSARETVLSQLMLIEEHVARIFGTFELIRAYVDEATDGLTNDQIRLQERRMHLKLQRFSRDYPQVQDIWVLDESGRPLISANVFPLPANLDLSDREYFQVQVKHDKPFLSDLLSGRVQDVKFFQLSHRRVRDNGSFAGVTAISVQPDYFYSYFRKFSNSGINHVTLWRDDGTVLVRFPELPNVKSPEARLERFLNTIAKKPDWDVIAGRGVFENVPRTIGYHKVAGYPLYVTVSIDDARVWQAWREAMLWPLLIGIAGALGLFAMTCIASRFAESESKARRALEDEQLIREQMEEERHAIEEALYQAQKMEAVARLTAGVAHDFNNILMIVRGSAEALRRRATEPARSGRLIDAIVAGAERGQTLTRQLLAFSRPSAAHAATIHLQDQAADMKRLMVQSTRTDIDVEVEMARDLGPVRIDRNVFEVALINLAVNARDAMPAGGRLILSARNVAADDASLPLIGEAVAITIRDTGSGIAPDHLGKVFEPFFTTKGHGKGRGLGLSQVYGFARNAGGAVTIESTLGRGTSITLWLPRVETAVQASVEPGDPAAKADRPCHAVLLVEDNPGVAASVMGMFKGLGYAADWVADAERAAAALASNSYELVLCDVVMPGQSGFDLAEGLARSRPDLPVILMTGYSEMLEQAAPAGIEVLWKPFSEAALGDAIARAFDRIRTGQRVAPEPVATDNVIRFPGI
ncbi:ATP-binding protein [Prosthecomicrobium hirschii]|uniref:ATP-binding protein n=1 Tax=Prosthecodimorpha hirschii TaxID=665126 RepID=UPI0022200B83|nr:ATP-binding protein [Prosthecomicrobium hirschii]MCW1839245.1 ATP-binding protein [Prosthecomicrobium hirschii]